MLANMLMCPNSNIKTLSRPNNLLRTLLQKDLGYTLMYIFLIVLVVNNSVASEGAKDVKGTWEYKVAEAPYEYSTGKIIFGEAEGKLTVKVKFMDGTEIKGQNVKVRKNSNYVRS